MEATSNKSMDRLRRILGMTVTEIAQMCNLSTTTVYRYFKGETYPTQERSKYNEECIEYCVKKNARHVFKYLVENRSDWEI